MLDVQKKAGHPQSGIPQRCIFKSNCRKMQEKFTLAAAEIQGLLALEDKGAVSTSKFARNGAGRGVNRIGKKELFPASDSQ